MPRRTRRRRPRRPRSALHRRFSRVHAGPLLAIGVIGLILVVAVSRRHVPGAADAGVEARPSAAGVDAEVAQVFGAHYGKARRLLACENPALDPLAVNVNHDGSRDIGVFQINSYWQGVSNEAFLKDYRINIRIAWNIYEHSNHTFALWSCGRKLDI
jgi:hypothetical protein